jgi:hypothetical protein
MDLTRKKKLIDGCMTCMPLHLRANHVFYGRITTSLLIGMALPVYKFLLGSQVRHHSIVHGSRGDRYMTDLKQYGLKTENLSRIIGGSFDNSNLMPLFKEFESSVSSNVDVDAVGTLGFRISS